MIEFGEIIELSTESTRLWSFDLVQKLLTITGSINKRGDFDTKSLCSQRMDTN